ncbi:uncharacterized protein LOC131690547 isoform X2 [Topomyia yanbarensis]|uniref:uncharacterized protein LOC131690547 isoform X2 n=1 Tax=Topomyia yanbarensis TaxID=2498891 RepID=UPI00273AE842|nr:uncharacterized protein LOC131690547 isoform X2 [Topomyia yanbarensis]
MVIALWRGALTEINNSPRNTNVHRYLATGDSQKTISFSYRVGASTVHQIVHETCRVITEKMLDEAMPKPTEEMWKTIAKDFYTMWNFPLCLGALDGKHVTIRAPAKSGSLYFNYKKNFSIVLLALVDAHANFIAVDVGSYGKNSDGGIFAKSNIGKCLEQNKFFVPENTCLPGTNQSAPYVIVGDEAFPLKTYLLRPYPGQDLDEKKRVYNYRLSRARRTSENSFGILASWCRMYHRTIHANPENVDNMILASCILHNFIRRFHGVTPAYQTSNSTDTTELATSFKHLPAQGGNASKNAFQTREVFKEYFSSNVGAVPWQ